MQYDREEDHQIQNLALLGQLAGGIAHDFNNLLTAMVFHLKTAREGTEASPEARRAFRHLDELMTRATTTTRQLLTFARARTLDTRPLEVNTEVARSLDLLDRLMGDSIDLFFIPSQESLWMLADGSMLHQAILNLCFNARDAMPDGGVVTVETRAYSHASASGLGSSEASAGEYVEIQFSDTGVGISPDHLHRVFEPFFTTKAPGKGTGLGLASVYGGIRQHGGWVEVRSELGKGATFSLYLPRSSKPADLEFTIPPPRIPQRGATVLVVEDETAVREVLVEHLERAGYVVRQAADCRKAWIVLDDPASAIDLMITDWMMPGAMKGLELATRVRVERPDLPVILMSGFADEAGRTRNEAREGIVILHKPFSFETLIEIVEENLRIKRLAERKEI